MKSSAEAVWEDYIVVATFALWEWIKPSTRFTSSVRSLVLWSSSHIFSFWRIISSSTLLGVNSVFDVIIRDWIPLMDLYSFAKGFFSRIWGTPGRSQEWWNHSLKLFLLVPKLGSMNSRRQECSSASNLSQHQHTSSKTCHCSWFWGINTWRASINFITAKQVLYSILISLSNPSNSGCWCLCAWHMLKGWLCQLCWTYPICLTLFLTRVTWF